eukprot:1194098-Prorocentrum_minimum.AAC.2
MYRSVGSRIHQGLVRFYPRLTGSGAVMVKNSKTRPPQELIALGDPGAVLAPMHCRRALRHDNSWHGRVSTRRIVLHCEC